MRYIPGPGVNARRRPGGWTALHRAQFGTPTKDIDIEHFLWELAATQEEEEGSDPLQEPVTEYKKWIVWRGHQVHMPD